MAIDKLEVEILAVGQGSCNVVKGLNTKATSDKQLEYLAILDAGGGSVKNSPGKEAEKKLEDYMTERANAMGTAALAGSYADLLLISHSDKDHYSIIKSIVNKKKEATIVNTRKDGTVFAKKVKESRCKSKAGDSEFTDTDDRNFAFSAYEYKIPPRDSESPWNEDNYAYIYRANTLLNDDFYLLKTFLVIKTGIIEWSTRVTLDYESVSYELLLQYFAAKANQVNLKYRYNTGNDELRLSMGDKFASAVITKNGLVITIEYWFDYTYDKIKFVDEEFTFTFLKILEALKKIPKWYDLFPFYYVLRDFILNIVPSLFEDAPNPDITLDDIQNELKTDPPAFDDSRSETANTTGTIAFGQVINSISSDRPAAVESLKNRAVPGPAPLKPPQLCLEFLKTPGKAEYTIKGDEAAYKKWEERLRFYSVQYEVTHGTKGSSDREFRNMNSIITITGLNAGGPHFIFPGDATVQNMWYNTQNNGTVLSEGAGENFVTLPHHGSYMTSYGKPAEDKESVLLQFIKKIGPKEIYISAGFKSECGHPNVWTMNECARFLKEFPECNEHIVYYNMNNEKERYFAYCKYKKPLFTTVSYEKPNIVAPSYQITFLGKDATGAKMVNPPVIKCDEKVCLKDFTGSKFPEEISATAVMTDHPIYDFVFED